MSVPLLSSISHIKSHGRTVDSNANEIANLLNLATSQASRAKIPEDQVVISTIGLQSVPMANKLLGEGLCVRNDLFSVRLP